VPLKETEEDRTFICSGILKPTCQSKKMTVIEIFFLLGVLMMAFLVLFLLYGWFLCRQKFMKYKRTTLHKTARKPETSVHPRQERKRQAKKEFNKNSNSANAHQESLPGIAKKSRAVCVFANLNQSDKGSQADNDEESQADNDEESQADNDEESRAGNDEESQLDNESPADNLEESRADLDNESQGGTLEESQADSGEESQADNGEELRAPVQETKSVLTARKSDFAGSRVPSMQNLVQDLVNKGRTECAVDKREEVMLCYQIPDIGQVHTFFQKIQEKYKSLVFLLHSNANVKVIGDVRNYWIAFCRQENGFFFSKVFGKNGSQPTELLWEPIALIYNLGIWKNIDASVVNQLTFVKADETKNQVVRVTTDNKFLKQINGKQVQVIATLSSSSKKSPVASEDDITDIHIVYIDSDNTVKVFVKKNCGTLME
jgi:hypothetical protein